jgi:hypothetical protein
MKLIRRDRRPQRAERGNEKSKRERGAAMVEFALISPLFFFLLFAGIEMGLMFRSHLAVEDMSRNAARVASIQRNDPAADQAILQVIADRSSSLSGDIQKVIIYSADTLDAGLPPECIGPGDVPITVLNRCNSYGTEFDDVPGDSSLLQTGGLEAGDRSQWQNLGIYIEYEHQYVTGFFDTIVLRSTTVEVVELDL